MEDPNGNPANGGEPAGGVAAAMGVTPPAGDTTPPEGEPPADGTGNGQPGGEQPGGTPSEGTPGTQTKNTAPDTTDPAILALMEQHGKDPIKLAQAKQSTDQQYGKMRNESVSSFAAIIKTNPDAIHSIPESMRDAVVKEVYGHLKIESYEDLQKASGAADPNSTDPFEESRKQAFIQDSFTGFATEAGLLPDENATDEEKAAYTDTFNSLSEIAVGLLSTESPLLGDDKSLKNAYRVAYFSTPAGQDRLRELGRIDGLKQNFGKAGGNINLSPGKTTAKDLQTARRNSMLGQMGGNSQQGEGPTNPLDV